MANIIVFSIIQNHYLINDRKYIMR